MPSPASAIVVIKPKKTPHRMPQMSTVRAIINHIYCFMPAANKPTKPEAYPGYVSSSPLSRPPSAGCPPGKCVAKMRLANPFTLSCSSLSDSLSHVHSVSPHRSQSYLPRSPLSFGLVTQKFTAMKIRACSPSGCRVHSGHIRWELLRPTIGSLRDAISRSGIQSTAPSLPLPWAT